MPGLEQGAESGATFRLAGYVASAAFQDLPPAVVRHAKTVLLDLLGTTLGAADTEEVRIASETVRMLGGTPECSAIGLGFRTNAQNAAFLNSLASHVLELDDTHLASITHVGAPVIPAILAMAERQHSSGADALLALVLGYEVCIRVAASIQPSHARRGFLSMGTCGTFGAAAGASRCLALPATAIADALGLAGMQSAGTNTSSYGQGDMGRRMIPSHAAGAGVMAALLAAGGFTGSHNVLEGRNGFAQAFADGADLDRITAGLGETHAITSVGLKPYSCNRQMHAAIDAFKRIRADAPFDPSSVVEVRVETFDAAVAGRPHRSAPESAFDAKMSIPFTMGVVALRGDAGPREYVHSVLEDAAVRAFATKVKVVSDPAITAMHPRCWAARVTVSLADGRALQAFVEHPLGEPEAPMSEAQVTRKFTDLATLTVAESVAAAIVEEVQALDRRSSIDGLMTLLRGDRT